MKTASKLRLMGAVAALAALTAMAAGAPASAGAKGFTSTIKIKSNKDPHFVAPDTVFAGQQLQIENLTNPDKIGPHTFSLVTKDALPGNRRQIRRCEHLKPNTICLDIAEAHEVNLKTGEVGVPDVDNGPDGWDTPFDGVDDGDTWFTGTEDETTSREVAVEPGRKLFFMCAVHPFMQGHVKAVAAPPKK